MCADLNRLKGMAKRVSEDQALWSIPQTGPEGYLQQEIRKCIQSIESAQCHCGPLGIGQIA